MNTQRLIAELVETLEDGRRGFAEAATRLADDGKAELAGRFEGYSRQRAQSAAALRSRARDAGTVIEEDDGSFAGALHRGWMGLKDALTGTDEQAILLAARRGEDHAVEVFEKALASEHMPTPLMSVVREQLAMIERTRGELAARAAD